MGLKQVIGPLSLSQPNSKGKEKTEKTYRRETGGEREREEERKGEYVCIDSPLHSTKLYDTPLCVKPNIIYQHIYYHGNVLSKNNNVV